MSVDLVAMTSDGRVIFREDKVAYLLTPPFPTIDDSTIREHPVVPHMVHRAVFYHGFNPRTETFPTLAALIKHVRNELQEQLVGASPLSEVARDIRTSLNDAEFRSAVQRINQTYIAR